jgi:hypothetical protein
MWTIANRAQRTHDPVDDLTYIDVAVSSAVLGWRDERLD